jgi:5-methylcytosine-specific restriction endonuclease McrA
VRWAADGPRCCKKNLRPPEDPADAEARRAAWREQSARRYAADPEKARAAERARGMPCRGCGTMRAVSGWDRKRLEAQGFTGPMCLACRRVTPQRAPYVPRIPMICHRRGTSTVNGASHGKRFCDVCRPLHFRDLKQAAGHRRRQRQSPLCDLTAEVIRELRTASVCPLCSVVMVEAPLLPASKEIDHIVPLNVGGTNMRVNLRAICRACNGARPKDGSDYTGPVLPEMIDRVLAGRIAAARVNAEREGRAEKVRQAAADRASRTEDDALTRKKRVAEIVELRESGLRWVDVAARLGYNTPAGPVAYLRYSGAPLPVVRNGPRGAHSWGAYKR